MGVSQIRRCTVLSIYEQYRALRGPYHIPAVSEIKLLFCALAGCTSHKTVHPEIAPCTLLIYSNNK